MSAENEGNNPSEPPASEAHPALFNPVDVTLVIAINAVIRRQIVLMWRAGCSCDPVVYVNGGLVGFNFVSGRVSVLSGVRTRRRNVVRFEHIPGCGLLRPRQR
jgi:hypothetical protein